MKKFILYFAGLNLLVQSIVKKSNLTVYHMSNQSTLNATTFNLKHG